MMYNHTAMEIVKLTTQNFQEVVDKAVTVLKNSGLIIYPTETCYGAGVVATDTQAVKKLLTYKKRPSGKAISIAVADKATAKKYVELNATAESVYEKFLPGPVTVISASKGSVAAGIASEFETLGIRIPDHGFALSLLKKIDLPITATSANSAGKKTPYAVNDILENLSERQKDLIDFIIDAGELPHNPPSTVIDTTKESMQVLRTGRIAPEGKIVQKVINEESEMREAGEKLAEEMSSEIENSGLLLIFNAELGAGKTQFVKGVAKKLGVGEIVKSPTYSLIEEYETQKGKLIHVDAWRMENLSELKQLGLEKHLTAGNVVAIEWSGAAEEYLAQLTRKSSVKQVFIEIVYTDRNTRKLKLIYT